MGDISQSHFERFAEDYAYDPPEIFREKINRNMRPVIRITNVEYVSETSDSILYRSTAGGKLAWVPRRIHVYNPLKKGERGHVVVWKSELQYIKYE